MRTVEKFLYCMDLQVSVIVLGGLSGFEAFLVMLEIIPFFVNYTGKLDEAKLSVLKEPKAWEDFKTLKENKKLLLALFGVVFVVAVGYFICSVLLMSGAANRKYVRMFPWLIIQNLICLVLTVDAIYRKDYTLFLCVCCNLQTAGVIIGGSGSVFSLYFGIHTLMFMKDFLKKSRNQELKLEHPKVTEFLEINQCYAPFIFGAVLLLLFVNFLVSTILLSGITKLLPQKLIPWLVYQATITIVILVIGLRQLNPILILSSFVFIYSCLKLYWIEAFMLCRTFNMDLVELPTEAEANYFLTLCAQQDLKEDFFHIGGTYVGVGLNEFYWMTTGQRINYTMKFIPGQPDNHKGVESYLAVNNKPGSFMLNDIDNGSTKGTFICQRITKASDNDLSIEERWKSYK
ncbi:unnamed protein product [Diamesa tonsa]